MCNVPTYYIDKKFWIKIFEFLEVGRPGIVTAVPAGNFLGTWFSDVIYLNIYYY